MSTGWLPVMDARQTQEQLDDPYWNQQKLTKVWISAAMFTRGLLHQAGDWDDEELAWQYVVERLGRTEGETLLGEAFPLPKRSLKSWPYTRVYPDRKVYKRTIWPQRQAMWQRLLAEYQIRYVVAYGGWWGSRCDTFGELKWQPMNKERVKVGIMRTGTQVYLTNHFSRGLLSHDDMLAVIHYS